MPPLKSFPPAADALQNYRPRCGRLPAPRTSLTPKRPGHHDILVLLSRVKSGVVLNNDSDFFLFFPAIYALTSTPDALAIATRAVLEDSLLSLQIPTHHAYSLSCTPPQGAHRICPGTLVSLPLSLRSRSSPAPRLSSASTATRGEESHGTRPVWGSG
ncbi:hypothetical protein BV22DRAFT_1132573 [Leucogyrophana mollusca]|uniref:Uncharacterized protein n=1 Tax=Leucogyrophana mollusca TaxID=85980 RepID=A0ACB8B6D9_9AGAM|nr:hypothetical protein BV22DRAFT_1132573 [Leucogyrophana mollusca]